MLFSSLNFLFFFLPAALLIYYISPRKLRNLVLFALSLVFYAWGEPIYVALMLFSTITDYILGRIVDKHRGTVKSRYALISSIIINILLLGIFKYADFIVSNVNAVFNTAVPLPNLPLPIGISFYTFQTMSYIIDVYRGQAKMQKNIITFGTYIAMFPQLIAGPIVRYQTVSDQLEGRIENPGQFAEGFRRFITGLAKKVLFANNIGLVWNQMSILDPSSMSVLGAWLGIIAFAFQIYFDFSGYSDMAIGLGKMLGFDFHENFNYPYISKSITEFWRRWHISLGTWFREYVYIPLGGNRKGISRQIINIAVVWLLTGIWHGASWNFVIWGMYFMVLLILEKLFLLKYLEKLPAVLRHMYALVLVLFSWVIFTFDDFSQGLRYFSWMFGGEGVPLANNHALFAFTSNFIMITLLAFGSTPLPGKLASKLMEKLRNWAATRAVVTGAIICFLFLISVAYLVDDTFNPFLYLRF